MNGVFFAWQTRQVIRDCKGFINRKEVREIKIEKLIILFKENG